MRATADVSVLKIIFLKLRQTMFADLLPHW